MFLCMDNPLRNATVVQERKSTLLSTIDTIHEKVEGGLGCERDGKQLQPEELPAIPMAIPLAIPMAG